MDTSIITDIKIIKTLLFNIFVIRNYHSVYKYGNNIDSNAENSVYFKNRNYMILCCIAIFLVSFPGSVLVLTILFFTAKINVVVLVAFLLISFGVSCGLSVLSLIIMKKIYTDSLLSDFPKSNIISYYKFKFNAHQTNVLFGICDSVAEIKIEFLSTESFEYLNSFLGNSIFDNSCVNSANYNKLYKITCAFTKVEKCGSAIINVHSNNFFENSIYLQIMLKYCNSNSITKLLKVNKSMNNNLTNGNCFNIVMKNIKKKLGVNNDLSFEYLFATKISNLKPPVMTSYNVYSKLSRESYTNFYAYPDMLLDSVKKHICKNTYISIYSVNHIFSKFYDGNNFNDNWIFFGKLFDEKNIDNAFEKTITFKALKFE